jgi:hypothetical protein
MLKLRHVGAALLILVTVPAAAQADMSTATAAAAPIGTGGRFVMGQLTNMRRDQYLLDTKTGRIWAVAMDPQGATEMMPIPYYVPSTKGPGSVTFSPPQ